MALPLERAPARLLAEGLPLRLAGEHVHLPVPAALGVAVGGGGRFPGEAEEEPAQQGRETEGLAVRSEEGKFEKTFSTLFLSV